jgi:hypothetical protein
VKTILVALILCAGSASAEGKQAQLPGAYERLLDRTELVRRELDRQRVNGNNLNGRKNASAAAARAAELPTLPDRPLAAW